MAETILEIPESMTLEQVSSRKRTLQINDDNKHNENVQAITSSIVLAIQDIFRCPICLETSSIPFKMCANGHINCCRCADNLKLKRCALCKKHFVSQNPEVLENILSSIPVKCPYHMFGCQVIYENNENRKHELFCPYRLISCRDCNSAIPLITMKNHFEERHLESYAMSDPEGAISWSMNDPSVTYHECPAMIFDQIFWVIIIDNMKHKEMKMFVHLLPLGEPQDDYYICIQMCEMGYTFSKSVKACVLSHWENSQIVPHTENLPEECYMLITHRLRKLFTNDSGHFTTYLYFSKIPRLE